MDSKRIEPEMVEALGITSSDVSGDAFIEAAFREQAESPSEPFFAVAALFGERGKHRRARDSFQASFNLSHKILPVVFAYYIGFQTKVRRVSHRAGLGARAKASCDDLLDHRRQGWLLFGKIPGGQVTTSWFLGDVSPHAFYPSYWL